MIEKKYYKFIKNHNLINRIYEMLLFFKVIKQEKHEQNFKSFFKEKLLDIEYVESLAKYFEEKLKQNYKNIELRCNLIDLITDLDYLKQYLDK